MTATWSVEHADGRWCVRVSGEFDLVDEDQFVGDVSSQVRDGGDPVLLDLAGLDFIDSSAVRALLRLRQSFSERVIVTAASDAVAKVLEIAGVGQLLAGPAGFPARDDP